MTLFDRKLSTRLAGLPWWVSGLIPLLALGLMLAVFAFGNPLALFTANLPPVENLNLERIRVVEGGFDITLVNGGPDSVTVAQVTVDDAYWHFDLTPSQTIPRLGRARLHIAYPWVENEPHVIKVITATGLGFSGEVALATLSPTPGLNEFLAYGLLGIYVGILPVGLGMLWFPAMKKMGRKWLGAILALTIGLLVFLLIDTLLESFEMAGELPGVFQGVPLVLFSALITWLALLAVGARRRSTSNLAPGRRNLYLAGLIAFGIGLHNLGEGLAIGAAFAIGEAALGSFLVIGFMLHNVTEGVGIVAPLVPSPRRNEVAGDQELIASPRLATFLGLTLLAGAPAILGAWVGGFAFSPLLATLFLGVGLGAIWQVIVEVVALLRGYAEREGTPLFSWVNVAGFLAGLAIMYLTAFLVKF
jgi:zinc transporter ZupT